MPARSATARWRVSAAGPTAQTGAPGAAASRASALARRERSLLVHEILHHAVATFERVELRLDLDDAAIELLSAPPSGRASDRCLELKGGHLAPPRGQLRSRASSSWRRIAERLVAPSNSGARRRRPANAGLDRWPQPDRCTSRDAASGGTDRIADARVRRDRRRAACQPERRADTRHRGQPGGRRGGDRPRTAPAVHDAPGLTRKQSRARAATPGSRGGPPGQRSAGTPARRRIPTSTAPAPARPLAPACRTRPEDGQAKASRRSRAES